LRYFTICVSALVGGLITESCMRKCLFLFSLRENTGLQTKATTLFCVKPILDHNMF